MSDRAFFLLVSSNFRSDWVQMAPGFDRVLQKSKVSLCQTQLDPSDSINIGCDGDFSGYSQ